MGQFYQHQEVFHDGDEELKEKGIERRKGGGGAKEDFLFLPGGASYLKLIPAGENGPRGLQTTAT